MKVLFFSQDGSRVEHIVLALRLRWPDLNPLVASQGGVGLQVVEQEEPSLVILCEDLPDMGIWQAIKEIRRFSDIPLIVAVEGKEEMDVVKAIELGADDYISMPCNLMIVMARVVALLRRVGLSGQRSEEGPIFCGDLVINPATYEVFLGSTRLVLTPTEFKLLHLLATNRHTTLSQGFIQRVIWSDDSKTGDTMKKYIQRLRRKLGDDARNPKSPKTGTLGRFGVSLRVASIPVNPSKSVKPISKESIFRQLWTLFRQPLNPGTTYRAWPQMQGECLRLSVLTGVSRTQSIGC